MLAGTALYIRLLVYAGLSLFIINGLYVFMVVCVVYAYNLTLLHLLDLNYSPRIKRASVYKDLKVSDLQIHANIDISGNFVLNTKTSNVIQFPHRSRQNVPIPAPIHSEINLRQ